MEDNAAKVLDAQYLVTVAADRQTASLTVQPPENGGAAPDVAAAVAALGKAGVVFGIDTAALANALGPALGSPVEVARGTPPQPGTDGWLEPLVEVNQQRHCHADERGQVDLRDRGTTPSVAVGDALLRRHPAVAGVDGRDVTGRDLPMVAKNAKFAVNLQGVEVDPDDPDLLRATVAGQPILIRDGIMVEPILRLENVDMASGNIEFIGSVEIRGDVQGGMRIKAGGDISVGGIVEAAELVAGGDIVVKGGVIGHSPQERKEAQQVDTARLSAKGSIKARYLENCVALAGQSVVVEESMIQSDVTAIEEVIVGQIGSRNRGGGKGSIVGGFVRATAKVSAVAIGGPGSSQTRVFVGVNPLLQRAIEENHQHLDVKLKESGELSKVLKLLATRPDKREIADKARLTLQKVNEEIAQILKEEQDLKGQLQVADQAKIVVGGQVHGGVMVAIGKKSKFIPDDTGPGVFVIVNDALIYGDLAAHGA